MPLVSHRVLVNTTGQMEVISKDLSRQDYDVAREYGRKDLEIAINTKVNT